jgi:hypothetical protein
MTSDNPTEVHPHGYYLEAEIEPDEPLEILGLRRPRG